MSKVLAVLSIALIIWSISGYLSLMETAENPTSFEFRFPVDTTEWYNGKNEDCVSPYGESEL